MESYRYDSCYRCDQFLFVGDRRTRDPQLEEPFSLLPQHKITNGIGLSAEEHVHWFLNEDHSNDRPDQLNVFNDALDFSSFEPHNIENMASNMMARSETLYYNSGRPLNL
jgi:hypothetical protein